MQEKNKLPQEAILFEEEGLERCERPNDNAVKDVLRTSDNRKDKNHTGNQYSCFRKIPIDDRISSFVLSNAGNTFHYCRSRRQIEEVRGSFPRADLSLYCMSLLIRSVWAKFRVRLVGIDIQGRRYQIQAGNNGQKLVEIPKPS